MARITAAIVVPLSSLPIRWRRGERRERESRATRFFLDATSPRRIISGRAGVRRSVAYNRTIYDVARFIDAHRRAIRHFLIGFSYCLPSILALSRPDGR